MAEGWFWIAYEPDLSAVVPFASELPALRHAVANNMLARKVRFGVALRDQIEPPSIEEVPS